MPFDNFNIIIFSKNLFEGDTTNFEYFLIEKNPEKELRKISKANFEKEKSGLKKVEVPVVRDVPEAYSEL